MRGRLQRHQEQSRNPEKGERLAMVGEARRYGCRNLIYMGKSGGGRGGWVEDPDGRSAQQLAWVPDWAAFAHSEYRGRVQGSSIRD